MIKEAKCKKCKKIDFVYESYIGYICEKCLRKEALKHSCGLIKTEDPDGIEYTCEHEYPWNCDICPITERNKELEYKELEYINLNNNFWIKIEKIIQSKIKGCHIIHTKNATSFRDLEFNNGYIISLATNIDLEYVSIEGIHKCYGKFYLNKKNFNDDFIKAIKYVQEFGKKEENNFGKKLDEMTKKYRQQ